MREAGMYKRKHLVVSKEFQGRFITTFVLICLSGMTAAIALFNYLAASEMEDLKWKMTFYESSLADIIAPHLVYLGIFAVMFTSGAAALMSWFVTWKVAGPIYRLKKDVEAIASGDLSRRVRLRKSDVFKDTAEEIDRMSLSMRDKYKALASDFQEVRAVIDSLGDSRAELLPAKSESILHGIEAMLEDMKRK